MYIIFFSNICEKLRKAFEVKKKKSTSLIFFLFRFFFHHNHNYKGRNEGLYTK